MSTMGKPVYARPWFWLLAILILAGLIFARDLLGLWHFSRALDAETQQASGPASRAYAQAKSCSACHGSNGDSADMTYPRLAGQPADYLRAQLEAYSSGQRRNPTMEPLARSLSPEDRQGLADYFAALTVAPPRAASADAPAWVTQTVAQCAACHGAQMEGARLATQPPQAIPRLAGQSAKYMATQLRAIRDGARGGAATIMQGAVSNLSDAEIDELALYLSRR
jgi:cytochrome c553